MVYRDRATSLLLSHKGPNHTKDFKSVVAIALMYDSPHKYIHIHNCLVSEICLPSRRLIVLSNFQWVH